MAETGPDLLDPPAEVAAGADPGPGNVQPAGLADQAVAADLLVEEISIDGMCGVY